MIAAAEIRREIKPKQPASLRSQAGKREDGMGCICSTVSGHWPNHCHWTRYHVRSTEYSLQPSAYRLVLSAPRPSPHHLRIKIIDAHSRIHHDVLRHDPAAAGTEQEHGHVGRFLGLNRLFPWNDLLGIEVGINVAGNARRGGCLQQPGRDRVETDA